MWKKCVTLIQTKLIVNLLHHFVYVDLFKQLTYDGMICESQPIEAVNDRHIGEESSQRHLQTFDLQQEGEGHDVEQNYQRAKRHPYELEPRLESVPTHDTH